MIGAWMFGATVFALLLSVAAFATERALRHSARATRTPWVAAIVVALVWPALAPIILENRTASVGVSANTIVLQAPSPSTMVVQQLPEMPETWGVKLGKTLLVAWAVLSIAMLARLGFAVIALRRIAGKSRAIQLDGSEVLVTESLGPAVIGLWSPRVAVPGWFLSLDAPLRKLVLRHELEHCRSRDPQLVWLASVAVALMPWNIGVWFLSRRLRLALEIDCDARTLQREESFERYGKLLLLIAQRQSSYPLASMLAESNSHLRQRISAMQMKPLPRRAVRVAVLAGVAATAVAAACSPRVASDLTGPNTRPQSSLATKLEAEKSAGGTVYYESQVENPVSAAPGSPGPKYPAELKAAGVEGRVLAMYVVNPDGTADTSTLKIQNSSHPLFTQAVREALPSMRFIPAEIGGKKVRQLVQQPMAFALTRPAATSTALTADKAPTKQVARGAVVTLPPYVATEVAPALNATVESAPPTPVRPVNVAPGKDGVYFESQVEVPVGVAPGFKGPLFPEMLKTSGVEGKVLVQFVVNEDGSPAVSSLKILKSDHALFSEAVASAFPDMKFTAATIGGRAVKQLVQQPFTFSLSR